MLSSNAMTRFWLYAAVILPTTMFALMVFDSRARAFLFALSAVMVTAWWLWVMTLTANLRAKVILLEDGMTALEEQFPNDTVQGCPDAE